VLSSVNLACTHGLAGCRPTSGRPAALSMHGVASVYQLTARYSSNICNGRALDTGWTCYAGLAAKPLVWSQKHTAVISSV